MITNAKIKAIANLTRLKIIKILDKAEELSVSELELKLKMSQSAISQHLAIMRAAGLVKTRRQAQQIFYSVQDEKTAATATMLLKW